MFHNGVQYGTLNSYKSAISLILVNDISKDPRITRFLKGVFRLRPPLPKYNSTWNPTCVLDFLSNFYPNETLSLEDLSKKCITLLALTTAHRVQTFSKIKIQNIENLNDKILIKIPEVIKTSRVGSKQPILVLPYFTQKVEICPAKTLMSYVEKTASVRKSDCLFISYKNPHNPVTTQTLSRWIKSTLGASGVDVSVFTAHSTRHASTSRAHAAGVNIDLIRNTAGWSGNSTTFARFYNRIVVEPDNECALARSIINNDD
ncbi:uncharacterized protein LOC125230671 [Leguminivora glycinivorella]|uniref:uncharacterized protein LOC125230671 n=1 Tax=Leguminivora glycinivorella TaxID=1035111 RepID=UPI00200C369B|nr:uncharacterized protein LOC125230671 [Leguminivora glycinivorella]